VQAYEIYQTIDPSVIEEMFQWIRAEERDLYKSTVATLAQDRKLRPVFVQKKSVADQISWLHKTLKLKSSDMIGEHLFQVYFMKGQEKMLISFCDAMGIEHDGKGSVQGELPDSLEKGKLKEATEKLITDHGEKITTLYLRIFNLQTETGWKSITEILTEDERLKLA